MLLADGRLWEASLVGERAVGLCRSVVACWCVVCCGGVEGSGGEIAILRWGRFRSMLAFTLWGEPSKVGERGRRL